MSNPAAAPPQVPAPTTQNTPSTSNTLGLIAIILAGIGFLIAVIPATSFIAWLPLLAAFVLSIIGLTRKNQSKGTSLAALIVSVVGWIVSIIVFFVAVGSAIGDASPSFSPAPKSSASAPAAPKAAGIGDAVKNRDGVVFTVSGVQCGLKSAEGVFGTETPTGEFCAVNFTVNNGSNKSIDLSSSSVTGYIGQVEYKTSDKVGHLGSDSFYTDVNPGLAIDSTLYIDVPAGASLDTVGLDTAWGFGSKVTIKVK